MKQTLRKKPPVPRQVGVPGQLLRMMISHGAKEIRRYEMGECSVLIGLEPKGFQTSVVERPDTEPLRWHMSVAHPSRYPTWDEIVVARNELLPADKVFAQILPASWDEYVNIHQNCFHLWEIRDEAG